MRISFIIPVYNEAPTLRVLVEGILANSGPVQVEILLIDDGSTDDSAQVIAGLAGKREEVAGIPLGAHRGKTAALKTGFERARGEIVFTMDSDLQDDPAEIPAFLDKMSEGYDLVCGWKRHRHDSRGRVRASALYNAAVRRLFGIKLRDVNCGFKAMRGEVAWALVPKLKRDYHRLIPVLAQREGYRIGEVAVTHHARVHGRSRYGWTRYLAALRDVVALKTGI